jgi:hypothetical protein
MTIKSYSSNSFLKLKRLVFIVSVYKRLTTILWTINRNLFLKKSQTNAPIMASNSTSVKEAEAEITKVPNWLELPRDITANILQRLDTIDIVTNVCHVCPLWWNIFKDPLMWRAIRMKDILINNPEFKYFPDPDFISAYSGMNLLEIFRYAIERSCGNLEVIDIEDIEDFVTDDLLQCIAKK